MTTQYHRYIITLTIAVLFVCTTKTFGQHVAINLGVDTTDQDIKAVITLWINYLQTKPNRNSIKGSPFWSDAEQKKYPKVDQLLNALNSDIPTYSMGNPTILYVKPKHDFFEIKTLFSSTDSLENVSVLCITSVFCKKENGQYKLYNALTVNSKNWKLENTESVTFHFPESHAVDKNEANKLLKSINNLKKQWNLQTIPIDYYFADTYEEIQHVRGFEYAIGMGNKDKPSGMADVESKMVFAGGLGENYFHEVVHIYLNKLFPKSPLLEGLAVFYGGSLGHDLKWHLTRLNDHLNKHPEINLNDLENFRYMDNFTNPNSTILGLLIHISYQNGGCSNLKKLMSHEDLYTAIENEFGIKKEGLNNYLRQQIIANKN